MGYITNTNTNSYMGYIYQHYQLHGIHLPITLTATWDTFTNTNTNSYMGYIYQ